MILGLPADSNTAVTVLGSFSVSTSDPSAPDYGRLRRLGRKGHGRRPKRESQGVKAQSESRKQYGRKRVTVSTGDEAGGATTGKPGTLGKDTV